MGEIIDGGHNLCSDASAGLTSASSRNSTDPRLGPLNANGGLTPTMALLPDSPALDAADASVCPAIDQRGVARPQGVGCDIGAFEPAPKLTLNLQPAGQVLLEHAFALGKPT